MSPDAITNRLTGVSEKAVGAIADSRQPTVSRGLSHKIAEP